MSLRGRKPSVVLYCSACVTTSTFYRDDDGDDVHDAEDNCPLVYNPGQEDSDLLVPGMVAYWRLEDGAATDSAGANDGTVYGAVAGTGAGASSKPQYRPAP